MAIHNGSYARLVGRQLTRSATGTAAAGTVGPHRTASATALRSPRSPAVSALSELHSTVAAASSRAEGETALRERAPGAGSSPPPPQQ